MSVLNLTPPLFSVKNNPKFTSFFKQRKTSNLESSLIVYVLDYKLTKTLNIYKIKQNYEPNKNKLGAFQNPVNQKQQNKKTHLKNK